MKTIKESIQALREEDHRRALYAALVFIMLLILFFLFAFNTHPNMLFFYNLHFNETEDLAVQFVPFDVPIPTIAGFPEPAS